MQNSDGQNGQQNLWNLMQSLAKDSTIQELLDMIQGNGQTHNQTPDQNSLGQVSCNTTPHNMCPTSCPNFFKEYCPCGHSLVQQSELTTEATHNQQISIIDHHQAQSLNSPIHHQGTFQEQLQNAVVSQFCNIQEFQYNSFDGGSELKLKFHNPYYGDFPVKGPQPPYQYRLNNSQFQTEQNSSTQQIHSLANPTDGTIDIVEQTVEAVKSAFKPYHDRMMSMADQAMDSPVFHSMKKLDDQEASVNEKYSSQCSSRSSSSASDSDDNTRSEKKRKKISKARKLNPCQKPKKRKSSKKCVSSSKRAKHASTRKK